MVDRSRTMVSGNLNQLEIKFDEGLVHNIGTRHGICFAFLSTSMAHAMVLLQRQLSLIHPIYIGALVSEFKINARAKRGG